jgi:hypothetical protein
MLLSKQNKQSICKFIHPIFRARLGIRRLQLLFLNIMLKLLLLMLLLLLLLPMGVNLLLLTHFEELV